MKYSLVFLLAIACAGAASPPPALVAKPKPKTVRIESRVHYGAVSDTLVMSMSWTNPVDDGRGPMDSLRIRFVGILVDTSIVVRMPFPTTRSFSHIIPAAAYQAGGSAGYSVWGQLTVYRRGSNSVPVSTPQVLINLIDAAPAPVTGVTFSAVKKP